MPRTLRILVADDYRDGAESLGMLLRIEGYNVCVCETIPEVLESAGAFRPDVVMLDLLMPPEDGFSAVARLRQNPSCHSTIYVAYTGVSTKGIEERCESAGFHYFLRKPATVEQIGEILRRVVAARRPLA